MPQTAFAIALDRLRNAVANTTEVGEGGMDIAYAAYVLARNGRPVMGDLRYLADTKLAAFATPLGARPDRGGPGAARRPRPGGEGLRLGGRRLCEAAATTGSTGADYGSRLRDGAGLLALAAETGLARDSAAAARRASSRQERAAGRPTSTQENAWMVLAAQGLAQGRRGPALHASTAQPASRRARPHLSRRAALDARPVTIANAGQAPGAGGRSASPATRSRRSRPSRAATRSSGRYHRLDGTPVDPAQGVRQNDRLVVVLKVTEAKASAGRLLLVDRLPAGLEIDNPKLLDADALTGLACAKTRGGAGPYRVPRRPLRGRLRPHPRAIGLLHASPTRCGRSRRAATSTRPRPSRTCTAPTASAAPRFGSVEVSGEVGGGAPRALSPPPRAESEATRAAGRAQVPLASAELASPPAASSPSPQGGGSARRVRARSLAGLRPRRRDLGAAALALWRFAATLPPLDLAQAELALDGRRSTATAGCCAPSPRRTGAGGCR